MLLTRPLRYLILVLTYIALAACGGGGSGSPLDNGGTGGGTGGGGTGGGTTDTDSGIQLSVELYDDAVDLNNLAGSTVINTVNTVSPGILVIRARDISSSPIANAIIQVETDIGGLNPANGRVLTDTNGYATIAVNSGDGTTGAGTLTATLEDATETRNFQVGTVPLRLGADANGYLDVLNNLSFVQGQISLSNNNLSSSGSTSIRVVVVDQSGDAFTDPVTVNFTSFCAQDGRANLTESATTSNGIAVASYEVNGCTATDNIQASIAGASGSGSIASGAVTIADSAVNSISFVGASPVQMAIAGTGGAGRTETSIVTFKVLDENGVGKSNVDVSFSLSNTAGGTSLTETLKTSGADGLVSVTVNAGTAAGPVRVVASIVVAGQSEPVTTVSDLLTISTGLPDQNSFSISAENLNPGGEDMDGITTGIFIRVADHFNNTVPDGTAINFTTEYGAVSNQNGDFAVTGACQTANGACSVTWSSQRPRTGDYHPTQTGAPVLRLTDNIHVCPDNGSSGIPCLSPLEDGSGNEGISGKSTILAWALGEEAFIDANGNGFYDYVDVNSDGLYTAGVDRLEAFTDMPEAFIDYNEDGVFGNLNAIGGCTSVGAPSDGHGTATQCAGWEPGGGAEEYMELQDPAGAVNGRYDGDMDQPDAGDILNNRVGFGNGIYNGSLCAEELENLTPSRCTSQLVHVRTSVVIVMSGTTPFFGIHDGGLNPLAGAAENVDVSVLGSTEERVILISDINNHRLPTGTTINVSANNCQMFGASEYELGSSSASGPSQISLTFAEDEAANGTLDTVDITVTLPDDLGGGVYTRSFFCQDAT